MSTSEESLKDASDRNVEQMEVDEPIDSQPIDRSVKANECRESSSELCRTSRSAAVAVTIPVGQVPNSQPRLNTPGNGTARPKAAVTRPTGQRLNKGSLLSTVRPSGSTFLTSGLSVTSSNVRPVVADSVAGNSVHRARIATPMVKTVVGQKVDVNNAFVMPADGSCFVFQLSEPGTKVTVTTGAGAIGSKQFISNSGIMVPSSANKTSRTPSIISRAKSAKKPSHSSNSLQMVPAAGNAVTPAAASHVVRPSLLTSSSNFVILNSPVAVPVSSSVVVPTLSSVGMSIGNSGRLVRLAGQRSVTLSPQSPGGSGLVTGAVRFPTPRPSPNASAPQRFVLTKTPGANSLTPQAMMGTGRPMSPLTSFRMQNPTGLRRPRSPAAASGSLADVRAVAKESEKLALKRIASSSVGSSTDEGQELMRKRRKFVPGRAYCITLQDGEKKRLTGFWENNMIRNFAGVPEDTGAQIEKDVGQSSTVSSDTLKVGLESGHMSTTSAKSLADEIADLSKDRFFYCAKCQTLTSNYAPCVTCNVLPQPCSMASQSSLIAMIPESPKKSSTVDQSPVSSAATSQVVSAASFAPPVFSLAVPSAAAASATLSQQLMSSAGQLKPLQKIIVMQSGSTPTKQIQIMRKIPDQVTSSPALRLTIPVRLQCAMVTPGARAGARPVRKKMVETQKRGEPDVVQILSSDDEDNQAAHSASQAVVPQSVPSSGATPSTATASQDGQEKQPDTVVADTPSAQAQTVLSPDHSLSIKIRIVRFGTLQRTSVTHCTLLVGGIKIAFNKDEILGCCSFLIPAIDLKMVRVHYGPCGPVLFIQTAVGVAVQVREILRFQDQCFDPEHKDDACRYITIIPDKNQVMDEKVVSAMFEKMQAACPASRRFVVQNVNGELASQLLKAKPSSLSLGPSGNAPTQTVFFITSSGQVIPRQVMQGELAAKPTEGDEEEEMADRSRSPSPPHPIFIGPIIKLFTYPPPPATGGIMVTNEDFFCLKDGEFLNDVIIDFYLKYLQREVLSKKDRDRTHVFSSFFYRRLVQKQTNELNDSAMTLQQLRHCRVKKWTKHVDLFSKDFIIVPINESAHWYLAIICFPGLGGTSPAEQKEGPSAAASSDGQGDVDTTEPKVDPEKQDVEKKDDNLSNSLIKKPCILIFDSLALPTRYSVVRTLREYLQCEWDTKKKTKEGCRSYNKDTMQGACPRCPRQTNFSDCGVYVLQYVESFFSEPIRDFTLPIGTLASWFSEQVIVSKRESLRQLVLQLQKGLNPKLDFDPCQNSVDSLTTDAASQRVSQTPGTPAAEEMDQADSKGAAATTSSVDSTNEQKIGGMQQETSTTEGVVSELHSSPKIEVNNTLPDDASKNSVSGLADHLDATNIASGIPLSDTTREQDANKPSNSETAGEVSVDETQGGTVTSSDYGVFHVSNQPEAARAEVGENVSSSVQTPAEDAREFSRTLSNDEGGVSTEEFSNADNFRVPEIKSFLSKPVEVAGGDDVEKVTSNYNGQLVSTAVSVTQHSLSTEQNSAGELGEIRGAHGCDSSGFCSLDTGYSSRSCKEALETSTAVGNEPS